MTNEIAIGLGAIVLFLFGVDWIVFDWSNSVYLAKKTIEFMAWISFWR